jgi:hypothetical protein
MSVIDDLLHILAATIAALIAGISGTSLYVWKSLERAC